MNPANGIVFYYYVLAFAKAKELKLVTYDLDGNLVRTIRSKEDANFINYLGGPSAEPVLSNKAGLNRFVWDMTHTSLPGIPTAYIEGSFKGHKAMPNTYTATLKYDDQVATVSFKILPNPLYDLTKKDHQEMHDFKSHTEATLTELDPRVNALKKVQTQIAQVVKELPIEGKYHYVKAKGEKLLKRS